MFVNRPMLLRVSELALPVSLAVLTLTAAAQARAGEDAQEHAQEHAKQDVSLHRLSVVAGLAMAVAVDDDSDSLDGGPGFYGSAEYSYHWLEWAQPRAYGGLMIVESGGDDCVYDPCEVSARIVVAGVKGRLQAPIPYVAPFFELGVGLSVGSLRTRLGPFIAEESDVVTYHIPFNVGLALGKDQAVELSFQFLAHPAQRQSDGALVLGLEFPLD
jgi:hypothetical protein